MVESESLASQQAPHISPSRASYGVSFFEDFGKKRVITAPHCTRIRSVDIMEETTLLPISYYLIASRFLCYHDDVIKWKYFPRYWPFVRVIHRSPVNFPHKGQWRGALMFTLICARKNGWVNNGEVGDLRRYLAHYDVIVMILWIFQRKNWLWHLCFWRLLHCFYMYVICSDFVSNDNPVKDNIFAGEKNAILFCFNWHYSFMWLLDNV